MCTTVFVPGGAKGVAAKLNFPYKKAWDDSFGFTHAFLKRF